MPSKLAKCLIQYIAFAFANAIVKMKPKNARFECEAEFSVFGLCFIFCATVVIPLGTEIDVFEVYFSFILFLFFLKEMKHIIYRFFFFFQ